jgi:hypothetical protein
MITNILQRFSEGTILDEVQRCSALLLWLQQLVDERKPTLVPQIVDGGTGSYLSHGCEVVGWREFALGVQAAVH